MSDQVESSLSVLNPMRLGSQQLDNRLAFNSAVNNLGSNREITDAQVAFYEARAAGGTGLIITEGMSVHPTSVPNPSVPFAFDPAMIPSLGKLAAAVHRHNRLIYGQVWHVGRQALWNPGMRPWAPSGERDSYSGSTPHVMSGDEVRELVRGFAETSRNLQRAGFDGVEIHGAHGYLVSQFLSPASNQRTDEWGGSIVDRSRFLVEVVAAIRDLCGDAFGIGLKLSVDELIEGGLVLEESQAAMDYVLDEVNLEYLAVSASNFSPSIEWHVADMRFPDVPLEHLARAMHDTVNGRSPIMAICKVPDLQTASRLIDSGAAEMAGMARALIADPAMVNKTRAGLTPRPCIFCNVCWDHIHTGRPAHCTYNPEASREKELADLASQDAATVSGKALRIAVLGAGPAGLEYARVAADRGHDVHVLEKTGEVGGRFRSQARVPGLEAYGKAADWLADEAVRAGAQLRLHTAQPDPGDNFDLVVAATGSTPIVSPLEGVATLTLEDALRDLEALQEPVFVVDEVEAEPVYAAVEAMAKAGLDVRLVTRRASIGRRVAYASLIGVFRRLDAAGVPVNTLLAPSRVEDGRLVAAHAFSKREHDLGPIGSLIQAGPYAAHEVDVDTSGRVAVIGDASAPRPPLAVVLEAHMAALELPRVPS